MEGVATLIMHPFMSKHHLEGLEDVIMAAAEGGVGNPMTDSQIAIAKVCDEVKSMLLEKNMKYGDAALRPKRVMSKASPIEQILVRIDDKLNRLMQGDNLIESDEDVILDLIGYFIILKVALDKEYVYRYNDLDFDS